MPESTRTVTDEALAQFIWRALERIPQDTRNRYARRVEAMGARLIAHMIVGEMRESGWTFEAHVRDPDASHVGYAKPYSQK